MRGQLQPPQYKPEYTATMQSKIYSERTHERALCCFILAVAISSTDRERPTTSAVSPLLFECGAMEASGSFQVAQKAPRAERGCAPTDGVVVAVDGYSFATDLLFNVEDVRARCLSGITTQSVLLQLLRGRIDLEREYAAELTRVAQRYVPEQQEEDGPFKNALAAMRAQYINTSVQHRLLAENLKEDVLDPLEKFHLYSAQKLQHLTKLAGAIKKQTKVDVDVYKREFTVFEKLFREASAAFATAMDRGISSTTIEQEYYQLLEKLLSGESTTGDSTQEQTQSRQKSITARKSINSNGHKLVNWLLSSDQQRKDNASESSTQTMQAAEVSRRKCCRAWQSAEQSLVNMYQTNQSILTEYQHIAEQRVSTLVANIQKHVVFESSALANLQYDCQMLAPKLDAIPPEYDIHQIIRAHSQRPELSDMTVGDLWSDALQTLTATPTTSECRPLKQCPLQVRDLARRKLPFDIIGSRKSLREVLVVRNSSCPVAPAPADRSPKNLRCLKIVTQPSEALEAADPNVAPAQDVARAIARAYELHVEDYQHAEHAIQISSQCNGPEDAASDVTEATISTDPSELSEDEMFVAGISNNEAKERYSGDI